MQGIEQKEVSELLKSIDPDNLLKTIIRGRIIEKKDGRTFERTYSLADSQSSIKLGLIKGQYKKSTQSMLDNLNKNMTELYSRDSISDLEFAFLDKQKITSNFNGL